MPKVLTQNVWYNGATSDDSSGTMNGMFQSCSWVEIQRDSKSVFLWPLGTKTSLGSNATYWTPSVILPHWTGVYYWTKWWYIFKNANTTPYIDKTWEQDVSNMIDFSMTAWGGAWNTDIVIIWQSKISRFNGSSGTLFEDFQTIPSWWRYSRPVCKFLWQLYIWTVSWIGTLTSNWVYTDLCELWEWVIALLVRWTQIIVVTESQVHFWNGIDAEVQDTITYGNYNFNGATIIGNDIFIMASDSAYSYILTPNGYWFKEVHKKELIKSMSVSVWSSWVYNDIETVGKTVYMWWRIPWGYWIITFGSNFPWMPNALSSPIVSSGYRTIAYDKSTGKFYIWWIDGSNNYITEYNLAFSGVTYASSGVLVTLPFYDSFISDKKKGIKMQIGATLPHSSTSIVVSASIDWWAYETLATINTTNYPWTGVKAIAVKYPRDFHSIQFKFELATSNSSYTPKLHDFKFEYDTTGGLI